MSAIIELLAEKLVSAENRALGTSHNVELIATRLVALEQNLTEYKANLADYKTRLADAKALIGRYQALVAAADAENAQLREDVERVLASNTILNRLYQIVREHEHEAKNQ